MTQAAHIAAIRAVQAAAMNLTLACTEIVGPLPMSVGMPSARILGEPVPRRMRRKAASIDQKERKR